LGFASYFVEALCDVALTLILYVLLRPVQRDLALLAAFLGIVSTTLFAVAELFYIAPSLILAGAEYLKTFSTDQLDTLALLSLKLYTLGAGAFMVFYGAAAVLHGYLIYRSEYLPRALGLRLTLAGVGFITKNIALVLAPRYDSDLLLLPMFLALIPLTVWLVWKGVDVRKWDERAAATLQ
jgi:hypothetical protein